MKKVIYKIAAIFLIPVLLFSTTSFSINKHICGGEVFSISFIGKVKDCGMKMDYSSCEKFNQSTFFQPSCCVTIIELLNVVTVKDYESIVLTNKQINVLSAFFSSYLELFKNDGFSKEFKTYKAPFTVRDMTVLYKVFRI